MKQTRSTSKFCIITCFLYFLLMSPVSADVLDSKTIFNASHKLRSMARVYMAFEDFSEATPLLKQACKLLESTECEEEYSLCLIDLAYVYLHVNEYKLSLEYCQQGFNIQLKVLGENHPNLAYTLRLLSNIYLELGNIEASIHSIDRALQITDIYYSEFDPFRAPFCLAKARIMAASEKYSEAEEIYNKYLPIIMSYYGKNNLYTSQILTDLGWLSLKQLKLRDAKVLFEEALKIKNKIYGSNHHSMIPCWEGLANILIEENNYSDAKLYLTTALEEAKNILQQREAKNIRDRLSYLETQEKNLHKHEFSYKL